MSDRRIISDQMPESQIDFEPYDTEVLAIEEVGRHLKATAEGQQRNLHGLITEIVERFFEAGFYVEIRLWSDENYQGAEIDRVWIPVIYITGRVEEVKEFDHDRMQHEVRSNLRGLNLQGDIQTKSVGQTGFERKPSGLIVPK